MLLLLLGCPKAPVVPSLPVTEVPELRPPEKPSLDEEYNAAAVAVMRGDVAGALAAITTFEADYGTTPYADTVRSWRDDALRIGTPAPPLVVTRWVQGSANFADHPLTLLVFFEPWCPHCQEEVPAFQPLVEEYGPKGLGVVAITAMTRGATEEMLGQFIELGGLKFPVGIEGGAMSEAYGVVGVPHLVFVRGDTVVWAGSAGMITLDLVNTLLEGRPLPLPLPTP